MSFQQRVNAGGMIGDEVGAGTYQAIDGGGFNVQIADDPTIRGLVSAGGHTLIASTILDEQPALHNFFVAIRGPTSPVSNASLTGTYSLYQFTVLETSPPQYQTGLGTIIFDGSGNYFATQRFSDGSQIDTASWSGIYAVNPDGTVTTSTNIPGLSVVGAVSSDGSTLLGNVLSLPELHTFMVAVKRPTETVEVSDIMGHYGFLEFNRLPGDRFLSGLGITYADGRGGLDTTEIVNFDGVIFTTQSTSRYSVDDNGNLQVTSEGNPGLSGAVFDSVSNFVGTTLSPLAPGLFDFVLAVRLTPSIHTNGIVNGASFAPELVAPGSIASVFGFHFGPWDGALGALIGERRTLASSVERVTVTFDGIPAPVFFVDAGQINIQVPFELSDRSTANVVVTANRVSSVPTLVQLAAAAPGIFSYTTIEGAQHAVAVHQDGSLVGPSNQARVGEVVTAFLTGLGATSHPAETGLLVSEPANANTRVSVLVAASSARLFYAGSTPGFVGLYQINMEVPRVPSGHPLLSKLAF